MALPAHAATYVVTSATDDASGATPGTLSWAITQANASPNNTIELHSSLTTVTVTGTLPSLLQSTALVSSGPVGILGGPLTGSVNLTIGSGSVLSGGVAAPTADFTGWFLPDPEAGSTLLAPSGGTITNQGAITGGTGAAGANNISPPVYVLGPQGGGGGAGAAAVSGTNFVLTNSGTITGGTGGRGGNGAAGTTTPGPGNTGGDGAAGVTGSGFTLNNAGTIIGGAGGAGGLATLTPYPGVDGANGANGVGVVATGGATIRNSGTIAGMGGANAVQLSGTGNRLILEAGFSFTGNVVSAGGDTLALGGNGNASFAMSNLGSAGAFRGIDQMAKEGTGTWTLTGNDGVGVNWSIADGTLRAGSAGAFANNTNFSLLGGTLDLNGYDLTMASLSGSSGALALGTAALSVNQSAASSYGGAISGTGSLAKAGTGTLVLTGTNTYSGQTTVSAGTLAVNGSIAQSVLTSVASGARLGGSGTLGATSVAAGGILAPGNSIGTLHIAADLTLATGAFLDIEINDAGTLAGVNNDLVTVGGTATLNNATLRVRPVNGTDTGKSYTHGSTYAVLTAANPVQGQFGSVDENFAFLDAAVDYASDPKKVLLTLSRNDKTYSSVGNSANQTGVGRALEGFDINDPVIQQLTGLSAEEARAAFDLISGEMHASGQHVLDQTFRLFQSNLGGGQGSGSGNNGDSTVLSYGAEPGTAVASLLAIDEATLSTYPVHSVWLKPLVGLGTVTVDSTAGRLDWWAAGLAAGYEVEATLEGGTATLGLGIGYLANGGAVPSRRSTSSGQGGQAAVYGAWSNGVINLSGNLSYGATHVSTRRDIIVGALTSTASANYWAQNAGLALEASYGMALNEQFTLRPIGTLNTGGSWQSGATETGAGALNITTSATGRWHLDAGIGAALDYTMALDDGGSLVLSGQALWVHAFGNVTPEQTVSLAGGGGAFAVSGAEMTRDTLVLGTGLTLTPARGPSLSLDYDGAFSSMQANHVISARAALAF